MKNLRTKSGPFLERPYFTNDEIDRACSFELQTLGLLPPTPQPIRIDRFIEQRLGVTPEYENLPAGILGYTRFFRGGVKGIVVARSLDDNSASGERRVRSTLAHEAGHGLFHAHLFVLSGQSSLFPEGASASPRVLCRDAQNGASERAYHGEWWEYQANRAIGSLLLPKQLVNSAVQTFAAPLGLLGIMSLADEVREAAARYVAKIFDVNPVVATIRLDEMFPRPSGGQKMF